MIEIDSVSFRGKKLFAITRQDFRNKDFNKHKQDNPETFVASNGFILTSHGCPQVYSPFNEHELRNLTNLYVRGSDKDYDEIILTAPSDVWFDAMLIAIKEYNESLKANEPVEYQMAISLEEGAQI